MPAWAAFNGAKSTPTTSDEYIRFYENRESIRGLEIVYEPEKLRFFQGRIEPLPE